MFFLPPFFWGGGGGGSNFLFISLCIISRLARSTCLTTFIDAFLRMKIAQICIIEPPIPIKLSACVLDISHINKTFLLLKRLIENIANSSIVYKSMPIKDVHRIYRGSNKLHELHPNYSWSNSNVVYWVLICFVRDVVCFFFNYMDGKFSQRHLLMCRSIDV